MERQLIQQSLLKKIYHLTSTKYIKKSGINQPSCFQFSLPLFTEEVPDSAVESMRGCGRRLERLHSGMRANADILMIESPQPGFGGVIPEAFEPASSRGQEMSTIVGSVH
jgi:hypothetical protein